MHISNVNQYPEGFLEEFTKPVTFRLANIKPDPDNPNGVLMPNITMVPPTSKVLYKKNEDDYGEIVNLVLVSSVSSDGDVTPDTRRTMIGAINGGEIRLDPKRPKDREVFNFLNHCHWNKSSPYASENPADWIIFKFDPEQQAKDELAEKNPMLESMKFISSSPDSALRKLYILIIGEPAGKTSEMIKNELIALTMTNSKAVLSGIETLKPNMSAEDIVATTPKNVGVEEDTESSLGNSESGEDDEYSKDDFIVMIKEALADKALTRVNAKSEFRGLDGETFFKFQSKAEAGIPAEEQLANELLTNTELFNRFFSMLEEVE